MEVERLPAAQQATEMSEKLRVLMALIRGRTDATAKGLAVVGTAAVSAIGYAKLADVFPYHGPSWAVAGLVAGLIAMVFAVVMLVRRFERLAETVITYSDAKRTQTRSELGAKEWTTLTEEYNAMAKLNAVNSLRAYNARAHRFERIADASSESETATALRARADVIRAEVLATQDRAVVYILRERAKRAFFHKWAIALLVLFLIGWYGTAVSADRLAAERSEAEAGAQATPAAVAPLLARQPRY